MEEQRLVQVQPRAEGEMIPEGVSCTETEAAYYIRVRKGDWYFRIRIRKEPLEITSIEKERYETMAESAMRFAVGDVVHWYKLR